MLIDTDLLDEDLCAAALTIVRDQTAREQARLHETFAYLYSLDSEVRAAQARYRLAQG